MNETRLNKAVIQLKKKRIFIKDIQKELDERKNIIADREWNKDLMQYTDKELISITSAWNDFK